MQGTSGEGRTLARILGSVAIATMLADVSAISAAAQAQVADGQAGIRQGPAIRTLDGFVANHGQWSPEVLFYAKHQGIAATLLADSIILQPLREPDALGPVPPPITLRLPRACALVGEGLLPTKYHFILGNGTTSNVPGFERVAYLDVAPGIDIELRADATGFAYDLHVAARASLDDLKLAIEGVGAVGMSADGTVLRMDTLAGPVEQRIGMAWEVDSASGSHALVASRFRLLEGAGDSRHFGFAAPGRDISRAFVLDPSLVFSTFVGGTSTEHLMNMDVAPDGAAYLTAWTFGSPPPTSQWAFQSQNAGIYDVWVGKLSPDGANLEWATLLGGTGLEQPFGIAVDSDETVVVLGNTWSANFPTTIGVLQPVYSGAATMQPDLFISRLAADGSSLIWSTFYGGEDFELAHALALFASGDVLFSANPEGPVPPSTAGAFDTVFGEKKSILARLSGDGAGILWQTYFEADITELLVDADSTIYMSGTSGAGLPTTPGALKEACVAGDSNGFVATMTADGSQLLWSTHLGSDTDSDFIRGMTVDAAGAVYVVGHSPAIDFPVTPGAFDVTSKGEFVAKVLPRGTGLVWATFLNGCCGGTNTMTEIAVDPAGEIVVSGSSNQPSYPLTLDAFQSFNAGSSDMLLTKFDAFGETLEYSTFFGGAGSDIPRKVGLDPSHDPIVGLYCGSSDLPTTPGAYDTTNGGGGDIAVAKFDLALLPWRVLGGGLMGSKDIPNLAGSGALAPGTSARFSIRGLPPSSVAFLIGGLSVLDAPFKGGTLVSSPDIILPLVGDSMGALDLQFSWPSAPAGLVLTVQGWLPDAGGIQGWSASNALELTSQ